MVTTPVTFTATATGGGANKEYEFAVQAPGGAMTVKQPYGPSNTFLYTPATIGSTASGSSPECRQHDSL